MGITIFNRPAALVISGLRHCPWSGGFIKMLNCELLFDEMIIGPQKARTETQKSLGRLRGIITGLHTSLFLNAT